MRVLAPRCALGRQRHRARQPSLLRRRRSGIWRITRRAHRATPPRLPGRLLLRPPVPSRQWSLRNRVRFPHNPLLASDVRNRRLIVWSSTLAQRALWRSSCSLDPFPSGAHHCLKREPSFRSERPHSPADGAPWATPGMVRSATGAGGGRTRAGDVAAASAGPLPRFAVRVSR